MCEALAGSPVLGCAGLLGPRHAWSQSTARMSSRPESGGGGKMGREETEGSGARRRLGVGAGLQGPTHLRSFLEKYSGQVRAWP